MPKFKIESRCARGWEDGGWTIDDKPRRFKTPELANAAITDFIAEVTAARAKGVDVGPYTDKDFRVVPAIRKKGK